MSPLAEHDPRLDPELPTGPDLDVVLPAAGPNGALVLSLIVLAGVGLFAVLEHQRTHPKVVSQPTSGGEREPAFAPEQPLIVPEPALPSVTPGRPEAIPAPPLAFAPPPPPGAAFSQQLGPPAGRPPLLPTSIGPGDLGRLSEPVLVLDAGAAAAPPSGGQPADVSATSDEPARASLIRNQGMIVPQGAVIPAVLETAIDSTRPGPARAVVSQDALSFDGRRVLIPRGSRLIGAYSSDALPGQRRALVVWTRLIRPDGVAIRLGSPASDPLGRGGIEGKVDSHFLEKFNGAILQSALDIGVGLASRGAGASIYLGGRGGSGSAATPAQFVAPTIRVRQGAEVTVLVARDLDFSGVTARP